MVYRFKEIRNFSRFIITWSSSWKFHRPAEFPNSAEDKIGNLQFPPLKKSHFHSRFYDAAEFLRPFGSKRPKVERRNSAELRFIVYRTQTILYSQCVTSLVCPPHYTHHTTAVCRKALLRYQHSRRHFC